MFVKKLFFCLIFIVINHFVFTDTCFKGNINICSEKYDRGLLVGKRGVSSKISSVIRGEKNGLYVDCDIYSPLQYRETFPNRWKISAGYLKKLTDHFTLDIGSKYSFLQRLGFEHVHQWMEYAVGIRSDLLMEPQCYLFFKPEFKEWGCEVSFTHAFDLDIFDLNKWEFVWNCSLGFSKTKRPFGRNGGIADRKDHYEYVESAFLLKKSLHDHFCFYVGPTFVYNTGGTYRNTVFNRATYKSHFCSLKLGIEMNF